MVWDKVSNTVYQRLYRKYRGKNFPKAEFQKEVAKERMREKMKELAEDPFKSRQKTKPTFKIVDITPIKNEGLLRDFFVDPSTIPKTPKEKLDSFMEKHSHGVDYETLMKKLRELDEKE